MVSSNSDTEIDFCLSPDHLSDVSHVKQVVSVGYQSQVNGYQYNISNCSFLNLLVYIHSMFKLQFIL